MWRSDVAAVISGDDVVNRQTCGQVAFLTIYRLRDGEIDCDDSHRIYLGTGSNPMIRDRQQRIFEETALAERNAPRRVIIQLNATLLSECWLGHICTATEVSAYDLGCLSAARRRILCGANSHSGRLERQLGASL